MRKIIVAGATIMMALFLTVPSFAAMETKVTGTFTLDGILNLNPNMASKSSDKDTDSFREMQLRINTETKINEKITFFTRFDILDKILSSQFSNTVHHEDDDNIQFDHAWMRIISPIGVFQVGRKTGVKWGTDFFDDGNEYGTDRLEYIVPIDVGDDKFIFGAVAEKALETRETNRDNDKFYLTGTYLSKEWKTGLLVGFYSYNTFIDTNYSDSVADAVDDLNTAIAGIVPSNPATFGPYSVAANAFSALGYRPRVDGEVFYIAPYFSGKVGPININAEFGYITGEAKIRPESNVLNAVKAIDATNAAINAATGGAAGLDVNNADKFKKKDVEAMCLWLEAGLPLGNANVEVGYAHLSGDRNGFDGDIKNAGFLGQGEDWEKLLILTSDNTGLDTTLNGNGNILEIGSEMNTAGMNLVYLGGSYDFTDNFSINGIVGYAEADKAPKGYKDSYGTEVNLGFSWKFLGNLEYNTTAGYLFAGNFWKQGGAKKVDDVISLYHELVLSF